MIGNALARVLEAGRDQFNAQFEHKRHQYPQLDADAFKSFLTTSVDPLATAVAQAASDQLVPVVRCAYSIGLELAGQRLVGPAARTPFLAQGFHPLATTYAALVATAPQSTLAAVSNALHHLAFTQGARPEQWLDEMQRSAQLVPDLETLLALGKVCAWRAGLTHFREGALVASDQLPAMLNRALFGLPQDVDWFETRQRLAADPWWNPAAPAEVPSKWVGGFRGFNGLFTAPPQVASDGQRLFVRSGSVVWLLTADVFGATFHKATDQESTALRWEADERFDIEQAAPRFKKRPLPVVSRGALTSGAVAQTTLALTFSQSHQVCVLPVEAAA